MALNYRNFTFALIALLSVPLAAVAGNVQVRYSEKLEQLEFPPAAVDSEAAATRMRFNAFGRRFDLQLATNTRLLEQISQKTLPGGVAVLRGEIAGNSKSWARIVVNDGQPTGLIFDGAELYGIEAGQDGRAMMFRLKDLDVPAGAMSCAATGGSVSGARLLKTVEQETSAAQAPGADLNIDISVLGDFEFTTNKGAGNAASEIITRMNNVDGIFSEQLGVQLTVTQTETFAVDNDPFSDESDAGSLLDELSDFRNNSASHRSNGLTHLFTGRDLDNSTVGVAFTNAICSRRFGAGLTQATHSVTTDSLIAAHEIGHNFGAPHDGTSGSACEGTSQDFLMAPRLNGSDTFSSCSIGIMESRASQASCVTSLPQTDIAVAVEQTPSSPLLGDAASVSFSVDSVGTQAAANTNFDVSVPSGVTLDSISATSGSCTSGAGTASCSLGSIAAGSGVTVTLNATFNSVGNASFSADVSATDDDSSSNNQATATVNVIAAVDLLAAAPAAASATVDRQTTIRPTVRNQADIAASNVEVVLTADAGLTIDGASWSEGSCSVSNGVATCNATQIAAQATATIDLLVTGTVVGSQAYSLSATASEAERNAADNDASGTVNVAEAPPPNSGGGGGAIGWLLLALLLPRLAFRKRRVPV